MRVFLALCLSPALGFLVPSTPSFISKSSTKTPISPITLLSKKDALESPKVESTSMGLTDEYRANIPTNRDTETPSNSTSYSNSPAQLSVDRSLTPQQKLDKQLRVCFKFGGSSLADASRIDHVANLIKDQIELGYFPQAVVCSAMGKTTNNLLNAGEFALDFAAGGNKGKVNIDPVRTLTQNTIREFGMEDMSVTEEVESLLQEAEDMLRGVKLLQELSPRSLDHLVR